MSANVYPRLLTPETPYGDFPNPKSALTNPDGLLAIGGDLHPQRVLQAYCQGIFPWYNPDQPILWWSPDPRSVLFPKNLKLSRSLSKSIRNKGYVITYNECFNDVVCACASPRQRLPNPDEPHTWLTQEMINCYTQLHTLGYAHSVECWHKQLLVGGLYGLKIGPIFFGESMFSLATDASKVAFVALTRQLIAEGCQLIDCQVHSSHLKRLGAETIPRAQFLAILSSSNCKL